MEAARSECVLTNFICDLDIIFEFLVCNFQNKQLMNCIFNSYIHQLGKYWLMFTFASLDS